MPVDNKNLTTEQENALAIYRNLEGRLGEPPSVRVYAEALGKSHSSAHHFIQQFRKKGFISMKPITIIRPRLTAKGRKAK
jgi:Mn-dependent DtxR family transcriptional regulator